MRSPRSRRRKARPSPLSKSVEGVCSTLEDGKAAVEPAHAASTVVRRLPVIGEEARASWELNESTAATADSSNCHPRESGDPVAAWVPAFAGMTTTEADLVATDAVDSTHNAQTWGTGLAPKGGFPSSRGRLPIHPVDCGSATPYLILLRHGACQVGDSCIGSCL